MMFPSLEDLMKSNAKISRTDLEYLQDWMSKQPHLPKMEDIELVPLLNRCDFSLEKTKDLIDKYLTMRTHAPELFKFRDLRVSPSKDQFQYFNVAVTGKDARGRRVVCAKWNVVDLSNIDLECCAFLVFSLMEVSTRKYGAEPGLVFVLDAANLMTGHVSKMSLALVKKVLTFLQYAVPMEIVTVHVINLNSVVDTLLMLIKPFLSKETQDKLNFHSKNIDALYEHIPKDLLPEDFTGTLPHSDEFYRQLVEEAQGQAEWLATLDRRVVDEGQRPGRAKAEGDVFGVDGSFKRLDFD